MATLQAERIGDVNEGEEIAQPEAEVDELGLTPEEREQFDGMKDADKGIPEGPEEAEEAPEEPAPATPPSPGVEQPPPPAETKKPEAPEEDDEPDQVTRDPRTGKEQRTISYGKHQRLLKKAREDAEALRLQAEEGRINHAKLAERLNILNDALTAPPPPPPQTPQDIEYQRQLEMQQNPMLEDTIDPSIDLAGSIAQLQRRQVFMASASMQQQEATQDAISDQALLRDFTRDTQMYSQTEEGQHFFGMEGAYQFLKNSRLVELGISLFDKDPTDPNEQFTQAEINRMISEFNSEEKQAVQNAMQQGKSPARALMRLAKGRGWKPPQPQAAPAAGPQPVRTSAQTSTRTPMRTSAQTPTRTSAQVPSAVAQIQAERAGAAASRSLSDGGGAPPGEPLSPEQLLQMSDEEFGIYIDNLPKQRLDALMGREYPSRG